MDHKFTVNNLPTHLSTRELVLIQDYSALVDKLTAENEVLRELLVKKQDNYILMYNSRERYKVLYTNLLAKVQGLPTYFKDLIAI